MSLDRNSIWKKYQQLDAEIKSKAGRFPNPFTAAANYLFGGIASGFVLQSQSKGERFRFKDRHVANSPKSLIKESNDDLLRESVNGFFFLESIAVGHPVLDTISLSYGEATENFNPPIPETHIINFCANAETYQDTHRFKQLIDIARDTRANVIAFNYPGTGDSQGRTRSRDDLINAGIVQVERLIKEGVDPAKITLTGTSLGGAVATMVAKHFNDRGVQLNLFNKQSFANLTDVVVGNVRTGSFFNADTGSGRDAGIFLRALGYVIKPIVKLFLVATKFEMDVAGAYRSLPEDRKAYSVAKTPLAVRWERLETDTVKEAFKLAQINMPDGELHKSEKRAFLRDAHQKLSSELKQRQVYLISVMKEIEINNKKITDPTDKTANKETLEYDAKLKNIQFDVEEKIEKIEKALALILPKDDGTITSYGSLHRALKIDRKSKKNDDSHHKVHHEASAGRNVHMSSSKSLKRAGDKSKLSDVFLNFHRRVTASSDPKTRDNALGVLERNGNKPK